MDPTSTAAPNFAGRLFGLFLWDEKVDDENPEDPSYLIRLVNEFNGYEGQVKTIKAAPTRPADRKHDSAAAG